MVIEGRIVTQVTNGGYMFVKEFHTVATIRRNIDGTNKQMTTPNGDISKHLLKSVTKTCTDLHTGITMITCYQDSTETCLVAVYTVRCFVISETIWETQVHEDFTEPEGLQRKQLEVENRYYDAKSFLAEKVGEQDLPDVEKFHYLKGCLAGEAKALVDPLKITRDNYQVAWQSLLKRYNNSKLLRKKQVQALFKLPTLTTEPIADLHRLVDGFDSVILTLDQIIQPAENKDLLLVEHLRARLDPSTRRGWEEQDLLEFQQRRIQMLEALPAKVGSKVFEQSPQRRKKPFSPKISNSAVQSYNAKCPSCADIHALHTCPSFLRMSQSSRESFLREPSVCRNRLKRGHIARECTSKFSCRYCKGRHHSLLCFKGGERKGSQAFSRGSTSGGSPEQGSTSTNFRAANALAVESTSSNAAQCVSYRVLLATAVLIIEDDVGRRYPARALLDSGSECNFISANLCEAMNVSIQKANIAIQGIGQSGVKATHKTKAVIKSRVSSYARSMEFLVLPKVTASLPTSTVQASGLDIPEDIQLADPEFFRSRRIDLVLGIQAFFSFFPSGKEILLGKDLPVLTESVFGWIVTGEVTSASQATGYTCNMAISQKQIAERSLAKDRRRKQYGGFITAHPELDHIRRVDESEEMANKEGFLSRRAVIKKSDISKSDQGRLQKHFYNNKTSC
ncbi:uncharacterized protein LOC134222349 [Armigeres subalbatus]|uniref:uncharacterized protein LOC134222349 n=1 Tax=Armigeres subalbatus TaxID=124917 RepID=UPI002ED02FE9